ncbi:MAG: peptidoglycan-binding protein [Bryobacteraceae bacterium]
MRTILCWAGIPVLVALAWIADVTTPAKKTATPPKKTATKAPAKKGATKAPASAAKRKSAPSKAGPRTAASRRGRKGPPAKRVTWRNRQLAPTPQRYKEIQDALAAKGYLKPEDANGAWNQASVDALKRFQAGQNLDSTGKINSLSLIALGLGPKRETPPPKPPAEAPPAP